ncbi:hypothetical protein [Streptomyces sp. NPDC056663]|uniref:hypothetical protein n=1 Tax=Streptomyces sp. NPDC056663 TaxID=3345899 RepID=UPI0036A46B9A
MDVWSYFEGKPEIFAALVALLVGVGAVLGAKIQANGGRDQAAAAREAAKIAAEAQHVAALWTVRQVQVAEYMQRVREVERLIERLYTEDSSNGELEARLGEAEQAMDQKQAELELIASEAVVEAAMKLREAVWHARSYAVKTGPLRYAQLVIYIQMDSDDPGDVAIAQQAREAVEELHAAKRQGNRMEIERAHRQARVALCEVEAITNDLASSALPKFAENGWLLEQDSGQFSLLRKMETLVSAAREMLRSEDNVAPTVPPQRRWWRRAA